MLLRSPGDTMLGSCHAGRFGNGVLGMYTIVDIAALFHAEATCHNYRSWSSCCGMTKVRRICKF